MTSRAFALTAAALCLGLVVAGVADDVPAPARRVEAGRRLFIESGCHGCHTVGAMGTPIGPDLARLGARWGLDEIERWLRDPSAQRPRAHMPKLELSEAQVRALGAYLSSLR
ncbi:MAG: hypothetical protein A3E31_17380 [Candidatus Rokubacteria bacterium RIFCSPHIGHO2_12_FULL_73_22]|nr:MAG: hypothetical protein A3D33_21640 [Candidatus Rokubacteria bacterium RIFCSPHIGHO2_02_FULL_73_26]OGK99608.1 MAG: hypothetical protein A3E31_17380 [Candidatus Rokubacteria bacterium RIFCSPHIGHO2_12_FULL_73_22]OGL08325.1 MAG: hypothetical protein A3I14_15950 [Candidatus Rokubacteria bacterium RIFCSPLOWO2_02_FULL_73_56]OGL30090.1 MAG: hypothetical protein A3G44_00360 [Candidatus Rokubacteria bacterium RIFCSPLOWO2_12_FULL_73_47]